ncbi:hypothetical protein EDB89DRAFT_66072 [Lactarius sanguifluus]|nr:hypothetical protein EDB89DRAFT_66072 [Lactarius sanguifluus]
MGCLTAHRCHAGDDLSRRQGTFNPRPRPFPYLPALQSLFPLIFFLPLLFFRSSLSLPSRVDSRLQSLRPFLEITLFDRAHTLHSLGGISALFFLSKLTSTALLSLNF